MNGELLSSWAASQPDGPWNELLQEAVSDFGLETGGADTTVEHFIEWLAEWGRELRRRQRGLLLLAAHRAKGLEFDHVVVLDGSWDRAGRREDVDAPRRLYYVAMTRARRTLTRARISGSHPLHEALADSLAVLCRQMPVAVAPAAPELARRYRCITLRNIFLSFAGYRRPGDHVRRSIARLVPGDLLQVRMGGVSMSFWTPEVLSWDSWPAASRLPRACAARLPQSSPSPHRTRNDRSHSTKTVFSVKYGRW